MAPQPASTLEPDRAALLRFEAAHEKWRLADAALADAEIRLWHATLRGDDRDSLARLAAATLESRRLARAARRSLLALLYSSRP